VFFLSLFLIPGRWIKSENPISLKVIHHRQNPIVTNKEDLRRNRWKDRLSWKKPIGLCLDDDGKAEEELRSRESFKTGFRK
jgi:hypothetical protein